MKQGWAIKTIADVCTFMKNGANIKQERGAGGVPITRIETLSGGVFNRDRLGYANIATPEKYLSYVLEYGDLLLSHINSKTYIGRTVVYVPENGETIIHGMNLLRLKLDFNLMSPFYFQYYTLTDNFKAQIANRRKDAVNQSSITTTDIKTILLPVPPIAEQEKIVAELDCLSGIIEKKKQQLKELDNLAQSIFYEMFGDPVENDKGWETKKVIDVVKLQRGYDLPIQHRQSDGGIPVWGSNGIVGWHNEAKVDYGVITGRSGTLGTVYSYDKPFFPLNTTLFSVDTHGNDIVYLKYLLNIFDLKRFGTGTGVPTLNRNVFHSEPIISVPLTLQQDFASKIESIEKQKELIAKSIKETETLFNSRMDYYFN